MAGLLGGGGGGGGGGPLDGVTGALGGATGAVGGVTDTVGGLTSGGALDSVTGLTGGLLGGGEGLNLVGLVGIGSDDPALLDLNPAEKKAVKAAKIQDAKRREDARQKEKARLQQIINQQQGGRPSADQQKTLNHLDAQKASDDAELAKINEKIPDQVSEKDLPASGLPGGGLTNGLGGLPGNPTNALGAANGLTNTASGLAGAAGGAGSALSAANGMTDVLGNATGGLTGSGGPLDSVSGLTGGLLGSGQGLNVAGLVGVGSDDPALLDLNPAEKKDVKAKKAAEYSQRRIQREQRQKELQRILQQQGSLSQAQREEYERITKEDASDKQQVENFGKWIDQPSSISGSGNSATRAVQSTGSYSAASACIPICSHTEDRYSAGTSLFYAYLVDAERQDPNKPASYLMTFANAQSAQEWSHQVNQAGYHVVQQGPQFYSFRGQAPYPVSYNQNFSSSGIGSRMMITGIKHDGYQMVIPPQDSMGFYVAPQYNRVAVINEPCHLCGAGTQGNTNTGRFVQPTGNSDQSYGVNTSNSWNQTNTSTSWANTANGTNNSLGPHGPVYGNGIGNSGTNPNQSGGFEPNQNNFGNSFNPSGNVSQGGFTNSGGQQGFGNASGTYGQQNPYGPTNSQKGGFSNSSWNQTNSSSNANWNSNASNTNSGLGGNMSLVDAARIAAREAKRNGDTRSEEDITRDIYKQLKGSCCNSSQAGGGDMVPAGARSGSGGGLPPSGVISGVNPAQAAASRTGGLTSGLGGLTGGLGGVTGGLGGLTGGLLGSGEGLNVAGIVGIGSDDPALLDLNPTEKKAVKEQRVRELEKVKGQQNQKIKQLQQQVQQQGGRPTPQQQAQYDEAIRLRQAANETQAGLTKSIATDDAAAGVGGLTGGLAQGGPVGAATGALPQGLL